MLWVKAIAISVILSVLLTGIVRGWQNRDDD